MFANNPRSETSDRNDAEKNTNNNCCADKNAAKLLFACSAAPSFPDEDDDEKELVTDGGRDTHRVRYVEYDGDGYRFEGARSSDIIELSQVGDMPIEAPIDECTPTDVCGVPLDTDELVLLPYRVWNDPHDDGHLHENKRLMTDGGIVEDSYNDDLEFGDDDEAESEATGDGEDDEDDGGEERERSTSTDFGEQFGADDDEKEEISQNIDMVERAEEIIDREGAKQDDDLCARIAMYIDADLTKEEVCAVLEPEFVSNDEGEFERRKKDDEKGSDGQDDAGVLPWGNIRKVIEDGVAMRTIRQVIAEKVEAEHDFVFVRNEEREMEDFRAYKPDEGVYMWDGAFYVEQVVDAGTNGLASSADIDEVVAKLKRRSAVPLERVNNPDGVKIAVENGVLDVENRTLEEHSPEHLFTRKLNARWDPNADTTAVREFVRDITDSEADALVLEEMFGDTLSPDYKREWFGLLVGDGANGKSVALSCLREILGENNVSPESLQDIAETRWSTAQLIGEYGTLANIDADISAKKITDDSVIKALTGRDAVSAEYKQVQKFSSVNSAKLLFAANKAPMFADDGENLSRRLKPLQLPYTYRPEDEISEEDENDPYIKVRDNTLEAQLTTDDNRAAWLSVMVDAWHRLEDDGWSYEQTQDELWDQYQSEADTIWSFLSECIDYSYGMRYDNDTPVHLTVEELHQMAASYHRARGETLEMDAPTFGRQINKMGVHEMTTFEPRMTGQKRSRKWLHPTGKGWRHATRGVIERSEVHCDDIDVPSPDNDEDGDESSQDDTEGGESAGSDENGGEEVEEDVVRVISNLQMGDAQTPTKPSIMSSSRLADYSADELEDALGSLLLEGIIEKRGDEFHTSASTDGGDSR